MTGHCRAPQCGLDFGHGGIYLRKKREGIESEFLKRNTQLAREITLKLTTGLPARLRTGTARQHFRGVFMPTSERLHFASTLLATLGCGLEFFCFFGICDEDTLSSALG